MIIIIKVQESSWNIYIKDGVERLFIECEKCIDEGKSDDYLIIPKGRYLLIFSSQEEKEKAIEELIVLIEAKGIAKWDYCLQIKVE